MAKRQAKTFNFTKSAIENLPFSESGRNLYGDSQEKRLWLFVTASKKSFYAQFSVQKKQIQKKLGDFPDMTVSEARNACGKLAGEMLAGIYVQPAKNDLTIDQMFEKYCKIRAENKTIEKMKYCFGRYLGHLRDIPALSMSKDDVQELKQRLTERHGKTTANRSIALLRSIYSTCDMPSPIPKRIMYQERERKRFITAEEMPMLLSAINKSSQKDYFLTLLFTGCRMSEACAMKWSEIDLIRKCWTIPPEKYKNGEEAVYSLGDAVIEILERRKQENETPRKIRNKMVPALNSEYVFPAAEDKSHAHLVYPWYAWRKILKSAGLTGITIHDLRRTHGTWLASLGKNSIEIARSLNQKTLAASKRYQQLMTASRTASQNEAVNAMLHTQPQ